MIPGDLPTPKKKPLLRGVSHAFAAAASVLGAWLLWHVSAGDRAKQITMLIFGASLVALYVSSAMYHMGRWKPRAYMLFRRLDHSMIFVLIAGTYTPFCVHILEGKTRVTMLALIWGVAALGAGLKIFYPLLRRRFSVPLYLSAGWLAVIELDEFARALGPHAISLMAAGGVAYTLGAIMYALRRPNLVPGIFGYHEFFHLLVIVGSLSHFLVILFYVAPAA